LLLSLHTIAFVTGLGSATLVYGYFLLELRNRPLSPSHIRFIRTISYVIGGALAAVWVSGAALTWLKVSQNEAFLWSSKIHAKLVIVSILTLNGIFIHTRIFPIINGALGRKLFRTISARERTLLLTGGGISFVSWYVPLALGYSKEIDGVVPLYALLALYACLILGALAMARLISAVLGAENREVETLLSLHDRLQTRALVGSQLVSSEARGTGAPSA
jgi:hypothetical protein